MRIVAGRWGGRHLAAPRGHVTRPTSDRVREATFSSLASRFGGVWDDTRVLDLFAGSGALGLEALSRGASSATFVERDRAALAALRDNIASLQAEQARIVAMESRMAVRRPLPGAPFTLLFLDPPYRIDAVEVAGLMGHLTSGGALAPGAVTVWEHASGTTPQWPEGFEAEAPRRYGGTSVQFAVYRGGTSTGS